MGREYQNDGWGNFTPNLGPPAPPNLPPIGGGVIEYAGSPIALGSVAYAGAIAFDTVGLAFYYTADGTTWTAASGGGGGGIGAVYSGNYNGGTPTQTPTGSAVAYDTSNGALWEYYGGAWH